MTTIDIATARDRAKNVRARLQSDQPPPDVRVYNMTTDVLNLADEVELAKVLRRYGTSPADIAARFLREAAGGAR